MLISDTLARSLVAGTPLLLATAGEIYAERSGVLNLGVEGMMAVGAVAAFGTAASTGSPWLGLLAGAAAGTALAAVHAFLCVSMKANQVVSGLALTMLGLGLSGVYGRSYVGMPLPCRFRHDPMLLLALLLSAGLGIVLFRTRWGIAVRSVGEHPGACEAAGVDVARVRYACVLLGGAMAGMAGAQLSLVYVPSWIEGMTAGRGWIVIALTIFAGWNPWKAAVGAFLFGGIDISQYLLQSYLSPNILKMFPYAATLLALLAAGRSPHGADSPPAALALPYRKGER
ncbi:MAG: ABC transporter permease [Elusimicrobiota bacterium]